MKKAKLLLFLVMILVVASMVLFACGDKDAHDCKDENFDHKCDVCEKVLSDCKDEDNDGFCDIYNEYIGCLSFTKNQDNTYSVYRCDGSRRDVIIPSTYKGLPVTSIGNDAFYKCTSLTSIEIPSSVTSIGEYAFAACTSLTIYCEAESWPSGWDADWNYSDRPVVWGYSENA